MARIVEDHQAGKSFYKIAASLLWARVRTREGKEWSVDRVKRAHKAELALRQAEPVRTKRCCECGEFKPLTAEHFHRNASDEAGFHRMCRACRSEYAKDARSAKRFEAVAAAKSPKEFAGAFKAAWDGSRNGEALELFELLVGLFTKRKTRR
jgi:hypothetical protein